MRKHLIFTFFCLLVASAYGQNKKVTFTGAGRLLLNSDRIGGELLEDSFVDSLSLAGDSVTARRELGGYALFDLGFDIRPNANTEIKAITRVRSELDGFWGAGIQFFVRELYARGLIKGVVRYKIGDIDTKSTPYTLWNNSRDLGISHASALSIFGEIIDYENFYINNQWRQQGADVDFALSLPAVADEVSFRGLISKNRNTDYFSLPDRLFALGEVTASDEKWGEIGYHYARLFEVPSSAQFSESFATGIVNTVHFSLGVENDWNARLVGELGMSATRYEEMPDAPADTTGGFFDIGVKAQVPESPWTVGIGYRMVESGFRSAGAQSRRLNVGRTPESFSFIGNAEISRAIAVGDLLKDPTLYNLSFTPELANYNPAFENAEPYGRATPNRQGVTLNVGMEQDSSLLSMLKLETSFLSEVQGRGISNFRNYLVTRLSAGIDAGYSLGWTNDLKLSLALSLQNTSRDGLSGLGDGLDGIGEVDLSSTFMEVGLQAELVDSFDFVAAMMMFNAEGNEYTAIRDGFNTITDYREEQIDLTESLLALGFRYRFSENVQLTVQQHIRSYENGFDPGNAYDMNQFVVLYNMFF